MYWPGMHGWDQLITSALTGDDTLAPKLWITNTGKLHWTPEFYTYLHLKMPIALHFNFEKQLFPEPVIPPPLSLWIYQ